MASVVLISLQETRNKPKLFEEGVEGDDGAGRWLALILAVAGGREEIARAPPAATGGAAWAMCRAVGGAARRWRRSAGVAAQRHPSDAEP